MAGALQTHGGMLLRSMTFGLLVGTLYATLSIGQDVHIHAMIAAEQRSSAPVAEPVNAPRIIDITAAAAANPQLLGSAVGLEPGARIVAVNDLQFHPDDIEATAPVLGLFGAMPGTYLDLTVRRADSREDRVLVLVH